MNDDRTAYGGTSGSRVRVLVVEDNATFGRYLLPIIERRGGVAVLVGGVRAATDQLANVASWAALILDVSLPDGSGLDILRQIRRNTFHLPALVVTGLLDRSAANAAYELGADYLIKPVKAAQVEFFLLRAIQKSASICAVVSPLQRAVQGWNLRYGLSGAESDILLSTAKGHDRESIAKARRCSALTVKKHVSNLLQKTRDPSFHEAVERLLRDALDS